MKTEPSHTVNELDFFAETKLIFTEDARQFVDVMVPPGAMSKGKCRLRVYDEHDEEMTAPRTFVVASELEESKRGVGIRAGIEAIAGIACLLYAIDPHNLVVIEHYPDRADASSDAFYLVHLPWASGAFAEVQREPITINTVEELLGGEF